jgi:hypothetical protein
MQNAIRMTPEARAVRVRFGDRLRGDNSLHMRRRRGAVVTTMAAMVPLAYLGLYQFGNLRKIMDPPLPRFDAATVSTSDEGYLLYTPDAFLGLVSYGATAALIGMGSPERARETPRLVLLAGGKALIDSLQALRLVGVQAFRLRRYCAWCLVTTGLTWATMAQLAPEVRAAWRVLRRN